MQITRRNLLQMSAAAGASQLFAASSHIRAGCRTNSWDPDPARFETLLHALNEIRDLGFSGFETHLRFLQPQMSRQEQAREEIASHELIFLGVHTNLPNHEELGTERALEDFGRHAMAAKQFGAKSVIANGPAKDPKYVDAAAMRALEMGVTFVLSPEQPDQATALVAQTNPKTVYFMLSLDQPGLEFFRTNPGRTYGIHLQDESDLKELAATVKKAKWISWLVHDGSKTSPAESRAAMKKVFGV